MQHKQELMCLFLNRIAEGTTDVSEQQRGAQAEGEDQDAEGAGQGLQVRCQGIEGGGKGAAGGGQGGDGSDQDAEGHDQAKIIIPPCPNSKTMKQPIQRKKLSVNTKARNDAYKTMASRLQDSVYEMGQRMAEVNGLLLLNSGVSAQFKGFQIGADQGKANALMPLLKELHHPDAQERKRGAAKLNDILKGVRSGSAQEADTPQEHISAAIQHLEKAVHGVVSGPQGQLTAVSAALGKVREAES